jgi:pilus assembly protein TadC
MIREDRLEHMTRMAMYEKKEGQNLKIAQEFRKSDYVGLKTFSAFLIGTLIYFVIYSLLVVGMLFNYSGNLHFRLIATIVFAGLILYVIFMFLLLRHTRIMAAKAYKKGKAKEKEWKVMLDRLEDMYKQEEQKDQA